MKLHNIVNDNKEERKPHYILCDDQKRPVSALGWNAKNWQKQGASEDQVTAHDLDGRLVGIIPASVGVLAIDLDDFPQGYGGIEHFSRELVEKGVVHVIQKSRRPGGGHILVRWTGAPIRNKKWEWMGCSGEIRHANGYVIIWDWNVWEHAPDLEPVDGKLLAPFLTKHTGVPTEKATKKAAKGSSWMQKAIAKADWAQGNRNDSLNAIAYAAARRGVGQADMDLLKAHAIQVGLGADEVEATLASGSTAGSVKRNSQSPIYGLEGTKTDAFLAEVLELLGIELHFNLRTLRHEWHKDGKTITINDQFEARLRMTIQRNCHTTNARGVETALKFSKQDWADAIQSLLYSRAIDTVKDWVDELPEPEPGVNLLETAMMKDDTFACEDTPLNREWLKILMVGMVMRVYEPGSLFRYMPILSGMQGYGKSTFVRTIVPFDDWVSESLELGQSAKEQNEAMRGKAVTECSELTGMRKADLEKLKSLITQRFYTGRLPYAQFPIDIPRTSVIVGTTNSKTPLPHDSENTRFLVLRINRRWVDLPQWMAEHRTQLWAEAKALYLSGYRPFLSAELTDAQTIANARMIDADESIESALMDYIHEHKDLVMSGGVNVLEFQNWVADEQKGLRSIYPKQIARALAAPPFGFISRRMKKDGKRKMRWLPPKGWWGDKDIPF